jgi:hypothetical protein
MYNASEAKSGAFSGLPLVALVGCAAQGARYSEFVAHQNPVASGQARVVLVRPRGRYDDYSLTRAVIRVNDQKVGKLAYGGFLLVDVAAGSIAVMASARNQFYGTCELRIETAPGDTVYIDVAPRSANIVASVAGAAVGVVAAGGGATHVGMDEILVNQTAAPAAAASAAGGAAASAVESTGEECGGPFSLTPMDETAALRQLDSLTLSD